MPPLAGQGFRELDCTSAVLSKPLDQPPALVERYEKALPLIETGKYCLSGLSRPQILAGLTGDASRPGLLYDERVP
jgi:hypothetical protein